MKHGTLKYENLGGIIESVATPPPNSFESLINYRHDKKQGGLSNRLGYRTYQDLTYQPDAMVFSVLRDCGNTLIIASATKVDAIPPFDLESGVANTSLLDVTTANIPDKVIASVSGTIVELTVAIAGGLSTVYQVVQNTTKGNFAVVVSQTDTTHIVIHIPAANLGWAATDALKFFKSDSRFPSTGFTRTLIGQPYLQTIDAFNNLVLSGEYIVNLNQSAWIGRIGSKIGAAGSPKSFFGGKFAFNGIYVGKLAETFTFGAFQSTLHHIQAKVLSSITVIERLDPSATYTTPIGTWLDEASAPTTTIHTHVADGAAFNDATYVSTVVPGSEFSLSFPALSSGNQVNPDGNIAVTIRIKTGGSGILDIAYPIFLLYELVGGVPTLRHTYVIGALTGNIYGTFTNFTFLVPAALFTDISKILVNVAYVGGSTSLVVSWVKLDVDLNAASTGIDNTKKNPDYAINFSLELDGSNETSLIYEEPYGLANNTSGYLDTTKASVGLDTTTNFISARISTELSALLNRRVTAVNVYGGTFTAGGWIWRFCRKININDSQWTIEGRTLRIDAQIGNEINTGPIYEDRTGRSSSATLQTRIAVLSKPSSRSLAVNDTDKNIVYFSAVSQIGVESAVIPSSNLFIVSDTIGDIVWLYSIGLKTIIFKSQSVLSIDNGSVSSTPRVQIITRERGLASRLSIASKGSVAFYVTYDGIYATDGFKDWCINREWINYFQTTYTQAILEGSVGFFDVLSDSYYIQFTRGSGVYDLWALDLDAGKWRMEEFIYSDLTPRTEKYGVIKFATKTIDNRTLFADDVTRTTTAFMQLFLFPREDSTPPAPYTNKIRRNSGTVEIGSRALFKTNPYDNSEGIREGHYIDGGYIKSNARASQSVLYDSQEPAAVQITTVNLDLYDGTALIKSIPIEWGREETAAPVRFPVSRFAIQNQVFLRGLFVIKEFGLYFKQLMKSGSIKQVGL